MVREFLQRLYKPYALAAVSLVYLLGEIGHFLIGATSKVIAEDLHYGEISCQLHSATLTLAELPIKCETANNASFCESLTLNGTSYCEWNYNGLGLEYQILAGPSFIAMYTISGVVVGIIADKYNRVNLLATSTLAMGVTIIMMGAVTEYWHLFILRMILAVGEAGVNPLATSLLSDWFPREQHGIVMSIFNWGVYGGWGITFPVGRYVPGLNVWGMGWHFCYYVPGAVTFVIGVLILFTLSEPERTQITNTVTTEKPTKEKDEKVSLWTTLLAPSFIVFCGAASLRQCAGYAFAYNSDLYYRDYFPDYDLGWWLFCVTIGVGSAGVVVGGWISDKLVTTMGLRSRVAILSLSQLAATPFAIGSVHFEPFWAMMSLSVSFFFAEMWLGILFAVLVEIVPLKVRSTAVSIFLFVINNLGGNLPILVEPTRRSIGFRESLYIYYAGFYGLSAIGFFVTMFFMEKGPSQTVPKEIQEKVNHGYSSDEQFTTIELTRLPEDTKL